MRPDSPSRTRLWRQGCGRVDGQDAFRLQPALEPDRHAFDQRAFRHTAPAMLAQDAEVDQHVAFHGIAHDEAKAPRRVEPFHPAGDRLQLGTVIVIFRPHRGPAAPFG